MLIGHMNTDLEELFAWQGFQTDLHMNGQRPIHVPLNLIQYFEVGKRTKRVSEPYLAEVMSDSHWRRSEWPPGGTHVDQ